MSKQDCEQFCLKGVLKKRLLIFTFLSQILTLYDSIDVIDVSKIVEYVQSLQKEDGSFAGDIWGNDSLIHTALKDLYYSNQLGVLFLDHTLWFSGWRASCSPEQPCV